MQSCLSIIDCATCFRCKKKHPGKHLGNSKIKQGERGTDAVEWGNSYLNWFADLILDFVARLKVHTNLTYYFPSDRTPVPPPILQSPESLEQLIERVRKGLSSPFPLPIPQQRAAPSYVPSYSSTIMVPSITQLCWGSGRTMIDEIFILKRIK